MSVVHPMFDTNYPRSPMLNLLKLRLLTPPGLLLNYSKKRSHSDLGADLEPQHELTKRSRTAPPSPPSAPATAVLPKAALFKQTPQRVSLPSLSTALERAKDPIVPTVLLDYFDTYKPHDENWRYGLLDLIRAKPSFLNSYSYLEAHAHNRPMDGGAGLKMAAKNDTAATTATQPNTQKEPVKLPPISELSLGVKPHFDSRVSKSLPALAERKINFPYESNYTYLNKTYMNDVERYPEYLELAQSLIQLSRPAGAGASYYQPEYRPPVAAVNTVPFTPENSFTENEPSSPKKKQKTKFIPITPPSVKDKSRSELMRLPPRHGQQAARVCISCGSDQSPCWRPSWSIKEGQLCNSCGLRYKKTLARCLNKKCKKIPAKGEWLLMQTKGKADFGDEKAYSCLDCGWKVEVK
ncbi:hypothetical protein C7M61_000028 [Candidozyma pseudohaemuli]|uniref:GATA-type domain-containing protein n=1 Tax=Candidozyma pseudohaemuli TaxID=418784 RepID=A0A2P7YWP8_9ASCO|nr:hypothetical protein C7M61_000028 [[Candida] pseudohaemulonii]PSK40393.1 hypothetical protein C7M61_000028 [[Candida] pseudohaemulonii]